MKKFMVLVTSLILAIITLNGVTKLISNPLKGKGTGFNGEIRVEIIKDNEEIIAVNILGHSDTPMMFNKAFGEIREVVVQTQSTDIDIVAGATASSNGLIEAINNALER